MQVQLTNNDWSNNLAGGCQGLRQMARPSCKSVLNCVLRLPSVGDKLAADNHSNTSYIGMNMLKAVSSEGNSEILGPHQSSEV